MRQLNRNSKYAPIFIMYGVLLGGSGSVFAYEWGDYTWHYNPATDHYYAMSLDKGSWLVAEGEAEDLGYHLVAINDSAEEDWLHTTFGTSLDLWIGFTQDPIATEVDEGWHWVNGDPVTYTNWNQVNPEPNDRDGLENHEEDWAVMCYSSDDTWADYSLSSSTWGIIETPEPGTLSLIALGGLMALRRRRAR